MGNKTKTKNHKRSPACAEGEIVMKNLSQIAELRERISAKNDIASCLPRERKIYSDIVDFATNECWNFDSERFESDSEYKKQIQDKMSEHNIRVTIFNEELTKVYQFLVK